MVQIFLLILAGISTLTAAPIKNGSEVTIQSFHKTYLGSGKQVKKNQAAVWKITAAKRGSSEALHFGDKVCLQEKNDGYLGSQKSLKISAQSPACKAPQTWTLVNPKSKNSTAVVTDGAHVAFKSSFGKYLSAESSKYFKHMGKQKDQVSPDRDWIKEWEFWTLHLAH